MTLAYIDLKTREGEAWLKAHRGARPFDAKGKRRAAKPGDMPRVMIERELAEWMLADKEIHTGANLGAKPRELPFKQFLEWNAPRVADAGQMRARAETEQRASDAYVATEAEKCVSLWRMVVEQIAYDVLKMWGCPQAAHREAQMFFESNAANWTEARESVCAMAALDPSAVIRAHRQGALKTLADNAIGRQRYETRLRNAEATAEQPDLFRSLELSR